MDRRRFITTSLAAGLGLVALPVGAAQAADAGFTSKDVMVTVRDGVQLLVTAVTPTAAAPAGGTWPVVILPGTYAGDGINANLMAEKLAARGFVTASYIERGLGRSTGTIDSAGPKDVADVSDVLTWVLANMPGDASRVGVASVSYGAGFIPMVITQDPRFKAGAMVSGWGDMWKSRFPGNTNSILATTALDQIGSGQGRMSEESKAFFAGLEANKETDALKQFAAVRSPMNYLPQLRQHNVPMYMSTSMNEMIWPEDQTMEFFNAYPGVKHLDVMPGDHATTELLMDEGNVGYTWAGAFDWMEVHVAGRPKPIQAQGPIRVAPRSSNGLDVYATKQFSQYPVEVYSSTTPSTRSLRYFLNSKRGFFGTDTNLTAAPGTGSRTIKQGVNILISQGLPMYQGALEVITGKPSTVNLIGMNQDVTSVWTGPALTAPLSIRGAIPTHLDLKPSAAAGTVFVYALDRAPDGFTYIIGHKPYSWTGAQPGVPMPIDVTVPFQAYDLAKGHRLTIAVSTGDINYKDRNLSGSSVVVGPNSYVDFPLK